MRKIQIKKGYYYLPEKNLLVNHETLKKFESNFNENKVDLDSINVNKDFLYNQLKNLTQIVLGITQNCNLRCLYCIFNENYLYERKLSKRHLDFNTALKGLEYISNFIKNRFDKSLTISFYGGEPFIKFDLVKKIVSYSKRLFKDWKLNFGVTTNATLLSNEIIKFLIDEDFNILISLDGPSKIHNTKRVYINGKATFNKVWMTLEKIRDINAEYFNQKVSFNIVYSYDLSLNEVYEFFAENELINKNKVYFSRVESKHTNYYDKINYNAEDVTKSLKSIIEKVKSKYLDSLNLKPIDERFYKSYVSNDHFNNRPRNILSGTCFFNSHLFLDVEGQFHICEKINNRFPIGNVWDGFYFDRMIDIVEEYTDIKEKYCYKCDINYLCRTCYITFASNGKLEIDKNLCSKYKKNIINNLKEKILFEEYKQKLKNQKTAKNLSKLSKEFRFHQFIFIIKGPSNSALVNFINGDIYQVPNNIIEHFESNEYEKIPEFMEKAKEFDLITYVNKNTWISKQDVAISKIKYHDALGKNDIVLCIEEGVDLLLIRNKVSNFNVTQIIYYGASSEMVEKFFPGCKIVYEDIDYQKCSDLSIIKKDDFIKIDEDFFYFSQVCNNCWGHKISITQDGKIRPCIHSNILIEDLENIDKPNTIEKIKSYWYVTKDEVEKCKDCELRYFCIDCREKSQRKSNGNLFAPNPDCKYNPNTGIWHD